MSGNLWRPRLESYLAVREAMGHSVREERRLLGEFLDFADQKGGAGPIRAEWALDWACMLSPRRGVRGQAGERQKVGGQAALSSGSCVCGCGLNFGYQWRNTSSRSSLSTFVLVCSKRWAPRSVHCICCFLTNRLLTTWLIVDSTKAVLIVSP